MREWNKTATTLLLGLVLWTFCLVIYLSHLPLNYTYDGMVFASHVERGDLPLWDYFHPHHLIYTFLGRLFFLWGKAHGATWDGLVTLQFMDILTGVFGIWLTFHLLVRETNDRLIAFLSALGLSFTFSYWYFSTSPGVRIFATVTPLLAWYVLTFWKSMPPYYGWVLGLAHTLGSRPPNQSSSGSSFFRWNLVFESKNKLAKTEGKFLLSNSPMQWGIDRLWVCWSLHLLSKDLFHMALVGFFLFSRTRMGGTSSIGRV